MQLNLQTRRVLTLVAFLFCSQLNFSSSSTSALAADDASLITLRGSTMGTTYMVKVSSPPSGSDWQEETRWAIERELRAVNDEMSTYLEGSEISRFNRSESTDWFDVSSNTADVVAYSLEVADACGGAFDVTIGPLVDRWSFGASERKRDIPSQSELAEIQSRIGYAHLQVRMNPPAIRKDIPNLEVDLSAVAKGHGVDRVVEVLESRGAEHVFVEIGGEVRVTGSKQTADRPVAWKVGIQKPDAISTTLLQAMDLSDSAMATSGDYRNYFEVDGKRFSHTIDPVTLKPVQHDLASVTVVAPTCMAADAWATAINVLGPERGLKLAREQELDSLLVQRGETKMAVSGTGLFETVAEGLSSGDLLLSSVATIAQADGASFTERMTPLAILTGIGFGAVLLAMAVGVLFGRRSIAGSCGGLNARTDPDGTTRCSMCSNPANECRELRDKINASS